jgi:hypothetical protein
MTTNDVPSSPAAAPSTTAAPAALPAAPAAALPAGLPAGLVEDDDPPATTMANLFKQKASPIRFFVVILIWAIGVLIVAVDTRRRTTPHDEPHAEPPTEPHAAQVEAQRDAQQAPPQPSTSTTP